MALQQNQGKPVPKRGTIDARKNDMSPSSIMTTALSNPASGRVGGVGTGSGKLGGGNLGGTRNQSKKK